MNARGDRPHVTRQSHLILHFVGAAVTKLAPPLVQFVLLLLVARESTLDDVGRLALASAASFLCGALAELGFATTLSVPRPTFGVLEPPLRATARLRVGAAAAGSLAYVALWGAGLGGHDPVFLLLSPLPFALALSYGYSGAMNASGLLRVEGAISVGESICILAIAVAGAFMGSMLTWALLALMIGRAGGTIARAVASRRIPQSDVEAVRGLGRAQLPFALATLAIVVQAQADMVAIGFVGSLMLAGVYGPLVRTVYSTLLSAEALSWGLYGGAHPEERRDVGRLARHWRPAAIGLGVVLAVVFALLAVPFLRLLLNRPLPDLRIAVLLFAGVIVARFVTLVLNVEILRAGRQRDEIPVLGLAAVLLGGGGVFAASANSIDALAAVRLTSELVIAGGYMLVSLRPPLGARPALQPRPRRPGEPLRLLFLTPFPPRLDGAHGGSRVIAQHLVRMAERHHVALLCLRHPSEQRADNRLRGSLDLVLEIDLRDHGRSRRARLLRAVRARLLLLAGRPLWVSDIWTPRYRDHLREVLREWRPDIVQVEYSAMGRYLDEVEAAGVPAVLWEPDPPTNAAIDLGRSSRRQRLLRSFDVRAWRRFERAVLRRVGAAVVFTDRDARALEPAAGTTPIFRIPFGTDFTERPFAAREDGGDVLFVGNFVHPPNIDAANRLVREIFPRVRERHPGSSLHIVGDNPPPDLVAAADDGIVVTGRVPDLVPYVERAAVVAAPIRFGGGMRVKVLEALAAGKPVVASSLAVEGLAVADGDQLLTAETDDEFAERISLVLGDGELRVHLAAQARTWAHENLSWDRSIGEYERLYESLISRAAGS